MGFSSYNFTANLPLESASERSLKISEYLSKKEMSMVDSLFVEHKVCA